jgi:hypothetical protein
MLVLILSATFVRNIYHSKKNLARYDQKCMLVFMQSSRYSCPILMKLELSQQFSKNPHILNFMKISPVEQSYCVRMDGQTDITKLAVVFSQLNYIYF